MIRRIIIAVIAVLLVFAAAASVSAEALPAEDGGEEDDELRRQLSMLELKDLEPYFTGSGYEGPKSIKTLSDLVFAFADGEFDEPGKAFDMVSSEAKKGLKGSGGTVCLLVSSALLTSLTGFFSDGGVKKTLSVLLGITALTAVCSALANLLSFASGTVRTVSELSEKTAPVVGTLLLAEGAPASSGVFRPLFLALAGTVIGIIEKAIIPLASAGGVVSALAFVSSDGRFDGFIKLIRKLIKWALGLMTVLYTGITAVYGLTASVRDGVMLRSAKYAAEKLVPIAGGIAGSAFENIMGCAALIKNGFGAAMIAVLFMRLIKPLTVLFSGMLAFRIAAAISGGAADPRTVKLLGQAADTASDLFACTAVSGLLFALTLTVFITAGGIGAGIW